MRHIGRYVSRHGFTTVELIVTMIVIGIMAAVAIPRFSNIGTFDARGAADQMAAYLRYAQKSALAQRRYVTVTLSNDPATAPALVIGSACGAGTTLAYPGRFQQARNITIAGAATICFDPLGGTTATREITFSADGSVLRTITVENVTGYVHAS